MQIHLSRGTLCQCGHSELLHFGGTGRCVGQAMPVQLEGAGTKQCECQAYALPEALMEMMIHLANLLAQGWEPGDTRGSSGP